MGVDYMIKLFHGKKTKFLCWFVNYILGRNIFNPKPDNPIWVKYKKKKYQNNLLNISLADCRKCTFDFRGNDNVIDVGECSVLRNVHFVISGDGNRIELGKVCGVYNVTFSIEGNNQVIHMGDNYNSWADDSLVRIGAGDGANIFVGNDCMIAPGSILRSTDQHSIIKCDTKEKINNPKDIVLGDHVWLAAGVTVLKGTKIGKGTIIGANSMLSNTEIEDNCLAVGNPVRVVKKNVTWQM